MNWKQQKAQIETAENGDRNNINRRFVEIEQRNEPGKMDETKRRYRFLKIAWLQLH